MRNTPLWTLLLSRKFWLAFVGVLGTILVQMGLPEDAASDLMQAIMVIVSVLIGSIALEDAAAKRSGN